MIVNHLFRKACFLSLLSLFCATALQAQNITVSGTVVDKDQLGLPGVTITLSGASNVGTVTNMDGHFTLKNVPSHGTLVVSYVGFKTEEVAINNQTSFHIVLHEDTELLDELVVIGYGAVKKKDLMGATSSISGDELATSSNLSVGNALQGKVAGVTIMNKSGFPGSDSSIAIRGIGTFGSGDNSPLVVIDGVPTSTGINVLNPADIESISVLKDSSSAAIYGSRAANGVILVTTKGGKEGKTSLQLGVHYGIQWPSHIPDVLSAEDYVAAILEMKQNKAYVDKLSGVDQNPKYTPPTTKYDGHDPSEFAPGTNWGEHIYRMAPTFDINMSVSGGGKSSKFYVSGGLLRQDGIGTGSSFTRGTVRANAEGKAYDFMVFGNNAQLLYTHTKGSTSSGHSDKLFNSPINPAYDPDGSFGEPRKEFTGSINPLAEILWTTPTNETYRLLDNLYTEFLMGPYFKLRLNAGVDLGFHEFKQFTPTFNDGGKTNSTTSYRDERRKNLMWVTDQILYYNQTLGEKHRIDAMLGASQQYFMNDNINGKTQDFVSEVENMWVLNGGTNETEKTITGGKSELALASYFGRINYDYDGRYLFGVNVRADGSSRFKGKNQWGVFPSFSAAWRISEEDFFNSSITSSLKLRGSWGQLGNQSIGSWYPTVANLQRKTVVLGKTQDVQTGSTGYIQTALPNPNLRWETTTVTNIGVDWQALQNRLSVIVDYYYKTTDGILRSLILPSSVGLSAPNVNYAEVMNQGVDLELRWQDSVEDFNYTVTGNVSYLQNKILKLSSGSDQEIISGGTWGRKFINRVGDPISALYGFETEGIITTQEEAKKYASMGQGSAGVGRLKYKDQNNDGKINKDDEVILGSHIPSFQAGLTLNMNWKNWDFNMVWSGVFGKKQHSPLSFQNRFPNRSITSKWYNNRWRPGDPSEGKYPMMIQGANYQEMNDLMVANTSYAKLKSLMLGYSFSIKDIRARVYLSGENLITITHPDFDGFDPENGLAPGHYYMWGGDYPTPGIVMMGLSINL